MTTSSDSIGRPAHDVKLGFLFTSECKRFNTATNGGLVAVRNSYKDEMREIVCQIKINQDF